MKVQFFSSRRQISRREELWWIAMHNDSLIMSRDTMAIHSSNMAMLLPSEIDGQSNERVTDMNHFFLLLFSDNNPMGKKCAGNEGLYYHQFYGYQITEIMYVFYLYIFCNILNILNDHMCRYFLPILRFGQHFIETFNIKCIAI